MEGGRLFKRTYRRSDDPKTLLQAYPQREMIMAASGGALYKGIWMGQFLLLSRDPGNPPVGGAREALKLSQFTQDRCMVIQGRAITRHIVVEYTANKLGGIHQDERRNRKGDEIFSLLDWAAQTVDLAEKRIPYFAVLATGQALIWSTDIRKFVEQVIERQLLVPAPLEYPNF